MTLLIVAGCIGGFLVAECVRPDWDRRKEVR